MMLEAKICVLRVLLILIFLVPLQGVTVKPVRCPTNKIAPHKRSPYYGQYGSRTFGGAYHELLGPGGGQQHDPGLQERPQEDDQDDCGEIEDYDESDLSSLNQPYPQQGYNGNRFLFGGWLNPRPPTTSAPTVMPLPTRPYWSGGYFSNNHYRPPLQHESSDYVKPVHEGAPESQPTYSPDIVGGPVGHVVGARPVRPSIRPPHSPDIVGGPVGHVAGARPSTRPPHHTTQRTYHQTRYPLPTTRPTHRTTRPPRPRMLNNDGILGSFIDLLLFK